MVLNEDTPCKKSIGNSSSNSIVVVVVVRMCLAFDSNNGNEICMGAAQDAMPYKHYMD